MNDSVPAEFRFNLVVPLLRFNSGQAECAKRLNEWFGAILGARQGPFWRSPEEVWGEIWERHGGAKVTTVSEGSLHARRPKNTIQQSYNPGSARCAERLNPATPLGATAQDVDEES